MGARPLRSSVELERFRQVISQEFKQHKNLVQDHNVAVWKAGGDRFRREFMERASLRPPPLLRLIDCRSTCQENQVVLIDWGDQQLGYTAISHTFGMEVYEVFNCECTSKCLAKVPRCSGIPCPQHPDRDDPRNRIVKDILNMCAILRAAGVEYIWHDGVCIAQHDEAEVKETIKHMGWIYANARETVIFLHYVGRPMATLGNTIDRLVSRWQTRVWTLQEGAVSKRRRYCVRVGISEFSDCQSLQEFEKKIDLWYRDDCSKVAVIEEDTYWKIVMELYTVLMRLCTDPSTSDLILMEKAWMWCLCVIQWVRTLIHTCFQFPTITTALNFCSARDSKHEGDRINSILALAGVKDFVAEKDGNMEISTIEFFKRQGQQGLARAVFTANLVLERGNNVQDGRYRHTWVPILSNPLQSVYEALDNLVEGRINTSFVENFIGFTVMQDGKIELRGLGGELACVAVKFTARLSVDVEEPQTAGGSVVAVVCSTMDSNPAVLAMDLMIHSTGFRSSLAQASSLGLGTAVVPVVGWQPLEPEDSPAIHIERDCCRAVKRRASKLLWKAARALTLCSCGHHDHAQHPPALDLHNAVSSQLVSSGSLAGVCSRMQESGRMAVVPNVSPTGALAPLTEAPALELGRAYVPTLSGSVKPLVQGREIQDGESFWAYVVLPVLALQRYPDNYAQQIPSWDWSVPALLVQGNLHAPVFKIGCFHLKKELKDIISGLLPSLTMIQNLVII